MNFSVIDLGAVDYPAGDAAQKKAFNGVKAGEAGGTVIFAEFPPVYTIGRRGSAGNLLVTKDFLDKKGIKVYNVNRGGDITVHSPGQLVVYTVFDLGKLKKDVGWYLRSLEQVVINLLSQYSIEGSRKTGLTGVWVHGKKVASIGIAVSKWISYYGFSLNINNDLSFFELINPCGIKNCPVTSMTALAGRVIDVNELKNRLSGQFEQVFGAKISADIKSGALA